MWTRVHLGTAGIRDRLCHLLGAALARIGGSSRDAEERRKRAFLVAALVAVIPALLAYGLADLRASGPLAALPVLGLAAVLAATLAVSHRMERIGRAARVVVAAAVLCVAREIATGGGWGTAYLWADLLPVGVFFVFGRREGALWAVIGGVVAAGVLAAGPFSYPAALVNRFAVTYLLLTLFGYALEAAREGASAALRERGRDLETALGRIRRLTGLLPICCGCKRIRGESGDWSPLESYLASHTEAQLTHGICPECRPRLYPEVHGRGRVADGLVGR